MSRAIAYYRVSTRQQRRSGLGIEAQRAAFARFAEAEHLTIIAEFVEAETGKGADALDRRMKGFGLGKINADLGLSITHQRNLLQFFCVNSIPWSDRTA